MSEFDVYAVTTAVSAFFAGLALGSAWFVRRADGVARPVLLYALLEACVGLASVGTTIALAHAGPLFASLNKHAGIVAWLLPFVLIGIPALLMGGTLPVLVRAQSPRTGDVPHAGGELYAANTAGAIAGALLASFVLIPVMGIRGTGCAAAGLNIALAVIAMFMGRGIQTQSVAVRPIPDCMASQARVALLLYSIAGGIALGYEVVWSQIVVQFASTRTFSFAVVLATYLAGLTIGSALYARWSPRARDGWGVFGFLIAAAGLIALIEIAFLGNWLVGMQSHAEQMVHAAGGPELFAVCARFFVAALGIVFVPRCF